MKKSIVLVAVIAMLAMVGCASLEGKSFAASGGVDAVKIETSGSTSTGTVLPNVTLGGAVSAIATSPSIEKGKSGAPVFAKAKRNSFLGEMFGLNCSTTAITYIGTPGESASETALRMQAIQSVAEADDYGDKKTPDADETKEALNKDSSAPADNSNQ